jgi:hypothetical protein
MADKLITQLTAKGSPVSTDEVPIYDVAGAATKKITLAQIATLGAPTWYVEAMTGTGTAWAVAHTPTSVLFLVDGGTPLTEAGGDWTRSGANFTLTTSAATTPIAIYYV